MRARVSTRKRVTIISIAALVLLVSLIFIIAKMGSLTRSILNNDNIRANVDCVSIVTFDGQDVGDVFKKSAPDIEPSKELLQKISENEADFCIINLNYNFLNNTGKEIGNFKMDIIPVKNTTGKLYAYSPLRMESQKDNSFIFSQSIVMKKTDIDKKYFEQNLPLGFEANLKYTFSYTMVGQSGIKTLEFTTVKREEEIDEYELLFENEATSDAGNNSSGTKE